MIRAASAPRRRRIVPWPAVLLLTAAVGVAGCGFKPLYGDSGTAGSPGVQTSLQSVSIDPIRTRTGQALRNFMIDRMNPAGQPGSASAYSLRIELTVRKQELGIRRDETASRANLLMSARYWLTERSSGAVIFSATSRSITSYNIVDNEYATVISERNARSRGAEQLAEEITTRVAIYFNRAKPPVARK